MTSIRLPQQLGDALRSARKRIGLTQPRLALAPLYDTLSTAVYPDLTPKMAMKIGSKYKFNVVCARDRDQFADSVGLAKAQTRKRILALAKSLPVTARQLQSDPRHEFSGDAVIERIVDLVERRCALTIRRLTDRAAARGEIGG